MRKETQDILNALRQGGIDTSSIENQMRSNPLADRTMDNVVGGGILRQQDYQRYMNELDERKRTLETNARELATLHDAKNVGASLAQSTLDRIKFLEDKLIETGEFDETSVRNVSISEKTQLEQLRSNNSNSNDNGNVNLNRNTNNGNVNLNNSNGNNGNNGNRALLTNEGFSPDNFVDLPTHQASMANLAFGTLATNLEINAALEEVRALGIKVDRPAIKLFQENLRTGFDRGQNLDGILEETFKIGAVRETKQKELHQTEIDNAVAKAKAEQLKELGVPAPNKFNRGRHVIFDRNRKSSDNGNSQQVQGNLETGQGTGQTGNENLNNNNNTGEPVVNKFGDKEVFRERGTRQERMQRAIETSEEVYNFLENDPTFID